MQTSAPWLTLALVTLMDAGPVIESSATSQSALDNGTTVVLGCLGVLRLKKLRVEMLWRTAWQPKMLPCTPSATVTDSCATPHLVKRRHYSNTILLNQAYGTSRFTNQTQITTVNSHAYIKRCSTQQIMCRYVSTYPSTWTLHAQSLLLTPQPITHQLQATVISTTSQYCAACTIQPKHHRCKLMDLALNSNSRLRHPSGKVPGGWTVLAMPQPILLLTLHRAIPTAHSSSSSKA
jgi:hypothetical protein